MNPSYPIYVVSKGRYQTDRSLTTNSLKYMGIPYYVIVEENEYSNYIKNNDKSFVLILPKEYQEKYDCFDNYGLSKSVGPGAARNFAWEHSLSIGAEAHWVLDDNINGFMRLNNNKKVKVSTGTIFKCAEDFFNRYENLAIAGFQYDFFVPEKQITPAFILNTRIYSCLLIKNSIPFRWRGRYNEDSDLSIRVIKDGYCTVLFHAFLQCKARTQTIKGGNTDDFYAAEGTTAKSQMLVNMHPDCCKEIKRFGRDHHHINLKGYKQILNRKKDIVIKNGIDNYGMTLKEVDDGS